jgi:hypothetical protein
MEENTKQEPVAGDENKQKDCGCDGGDCCQPQKSNKLAKIIFGIILLAALSIIVVKLVNPPAPAAPEKAGCCADPKASGCDTTKTAGCDTTKSSSCCSKK